MSQKTAGKSTRTTTEVLITEHRKAKFEYEIDDTLEAGLQLTGSEVKALRAREANLNDSYVLPHKGEMYLHNAHIGAYKPSSFFAHTPTRQRKLLLHKQEIEKWSSKVQERGYSIIPLALYFKNGIAKVRIALAKGRTKDDKRHAIKERETKRELSKVLRRK